MVKDGDGILDGLMSGLYAMVKVLDVVEFVMMKSITLCTSI